MNGFRQFLEAISYRCGNIEFSVEYLMTYTEIVFNNVSVNKIKRNESCLRDLFTRIVKKIKLDKSNKCCFLVDMAVQDLVTISSWEKESRDLLHELLIEAAFQEHLVIQERKRMYSEVAWELTFVKIDTEDELRPYGAYPEDYYH